MARPKLNINPLEVIKLAAMGCSNKEIAAFFDCSTDTIEGRFSAELVKGKEAGRTKLRRLQWQAVERGNVVMMIWLGKQMLDQKNEIQLSGSGGGPIDIQTSFDSEAKLLLEELKSVMENARNERTKDPSPKG